VSGSFIRASSGQEVALERFAPGLSRSVEPERLLEAGAVEPERLLEAGAQATSLHYGYEDTPIL
jgi:hypothetical protein